MTEIWRIIGVVFAMFGYVMAALSNEEDMLVSQLFANYNKNVKPTRKATSLVNVFVSYRLFKISGIDEKAGSMTLYGWLFLTWQDETLMWNPSDFNNITSVVLPADMLWKPEIFVQNSVEDGNDMSVDNDMYFRIALYYDGWVSWAPFIKSVTSCDLDVSYFPIDQQTCAVVFQNLLYATTVPPGTNLIWQAMSPFLSSVIDISAYHGSSDWDLVTTNYNTSFAIKPITMIYFGFVLKRVPTYFVMNVFLPSICLSFLSAMVFRMPSEAGEKMGLSVTVLMSYSVFLMIMADNVPRSNKLPIIMYFIVGCFILNTLSVIASIFVLHLHHMDDDNDLIHRWITRLTQRNSKVSNERWADSSHDLRVFSRSHNDSSILLEASTTGNSNERSKQSEDSRRENVTAVDNWLAELKREKIVKTMKKERHNKIALAVDRILLWSFFILIVLAVIIIALLFIIESVTQSKILQFKDDVV